MTVTATALLGFASYADNSFELIVRDDVSGMDDDECPICGGEGVVFDCFDGCCEDADVGCDDCTRPCECQKRQAPAELQEVLREALAQQIEAQKLK